MDNPDLLGDPNVKVRDGMELHCDVAVRQNNLEITWGSGNYFHLTEMNSATCTTDDPEVRDDGGSHQGTGVGRCNGTPAVVRWTFVDNASSVLPDMGEIAIEPPEGGAGCFLTVTARPLIGGNFTFIDDPNI
jgi:hypothetical protein